MQRALAFASPVRPKEDKDKLKQKYRDGLTFQKVSVEDRDILFQGLEKGKNQKGGNYGFKVEDIES